MTTVTVEQMEDHFLYLPVHLAISQGCFGYLPKGYELRLTPSYPPTDRQAFNRLMDPETGVFFAVCDPTEVIRSSEYPDVEPAVLATVVTNAAFWAVNRGTHQIQLFRDLAQYEEIISYGPGTTSYGIASRIASNNTGKVKLRSVSVGHELTRLKESSKGVVALTPNVLGLEELLADTNSKFAIDLELSRTLEYHDVLVSALLSRADVFRNHRGLVLGLLRALQAAMLHCRMESEMVLDYVRSRYDPDHAVSALRRANANDLFPASIEIKADEWHQAMRARIETEGRKYEDDEQRTAEEVYARFARPYTKIVREDIHRAVLHGPLPEHPRPPAYREIVLWLMGLVALTGVAKLILPSGQRWPYGVAAFAFVLAVGRAVEHLFRIGASHPLRLAVRISGLVLAGIAAALTVLGVGVADALLAAAFLILAVLFGALMSRRTTKENGK